MRHTLEQIEKNLINDDRQLLLMILEENMETNRLLRLIHGVNEQVDLPLDENKIDEKKRGTLKGGIK